MFAFFKNARTRLQYLCPNRFIAYSVLDDSFSEITNKIGYKRNTKIKSYDFERAQ